MPPFKAFRIHSENGKIIPRLENIRLDDLSEGNVVIRGAYSSINYKDALGATGTGKIQRRFPLVAGIDIAGTVVESTDPRFAEGDEVVATGCGLGETHDGGFAQYVRINGDWVNPLPAGLDLRSAMVLGTAGFTAGLAIHRMEQNAMCPANGPIAVTGATGGVGSVVVDMLSGLGYEVTAITGKTDDAAVSWLSQLGAKEILRRQEIEMGARPLEKALWAGAVDNLGGDILAWLTRTTRNYGCVASIGLAASVELKTTVMPFILRGVSLLGISSVDVPIDMRREVWTRVATDLKPGHLQQLVTREVTLDDLAECFQAYIDAQITGRTIVRLD